MDAECSWGVFLRVAYENRQCRASLRRDSGAAGGSGGES